MRRVVVTRQEARVENIVLVHGAWVDASGWRSVYDLLVAQGYHVSLVQEPLTAFAADVAAVRRVLDAQRGPCILVGHSYGGSLITETGLHPAVAGLVYVAATAPDIGEAEGALARCCPSATQRQPGAMLTTPDGFTQLSTEAFCNNFAPDIPRATALFEARSQVPTAAAVFETPLTAAAWRTKPSWAIVAGADRIINPALERWYYRRAQSHTIELAGASHSVYRSRPHEVAAVIEAAAQHALGSHC